MANNIKIEIKDYSAKVLSELDSQIKVALQAIGQECEGYAKDECPVDIGRLKNSISNKVIDDSVYVGTNVKYAKYVELGTGIYAENGRGRKTPWMFYYERLGIWVRTRGMKPHHFLRNSMSDHVEHIKSILKAALES